MGEQAVERAFEVAAVVGDRPGDDRRAPAPARRRPAWCERAAATRDFRISSRSSSPSDAHLDDEAAGEARAHALVEGLEVGRRPVGGDHDLPAGVDQGVERVAELRLDRLALQELQVVDEQQVDARAAPP